MIYTQTKEQSNRNDTPIEMNQILNLTLSDQWNLRLSKDSQDMWTIQIGKRIPKNSIFEKITVVI